MLKKCLTIAAVMTAATVALAAFSWADDDESPLHKLMEQVSKRNATITGAVKSPVAYKRAQAKAAKAAEDLLKFAKDAKKDLSAVKKQNKSQAEWDKLSDDFIKKADDLAKALGDSETTQEVAKKAHAPVKASCTPCHDVFKVDEK